MNQRGQVDRQRPRGGANIIARRKSPWGLAKDDDAHLEKEDDVKKKAGVHQRLNIVKGLKMSM